MLKPSHPDNICTVGWTCVHAFLNAQDMRFLKGMCPDGHFTLSGGRHARLQQTYNGQWPYYFNFPMDDRGKKLLRWWHTRMAWECFLDDSTA